jgi:hypothetical protein
MAENLAANRRTIQTYIQVQGENDNPLHFELVKLQAFYKLVTTKLRR